MQHENEESTRQLGCAHSRIPDIEPPSRLATPRYDGLPQFRLLNKIIRTTLFSCGRFPAYLRGDFIEGLIEEGVMLGMVLLDRPDKEIISGAKSIARRLIHREKHERRWKEFDPKTGKTIRKSEATMRVVHPTLSTDADGQEVWVSPLDSLRVDADGQIIGTINLNLVEERMVAYLDRTAQQVQVMHAVGPENFRRLQQIVAIIGPDAAQWMIDYVERSGSGTTNADRQRFWRLKKKLERGLAA